jgi:hypothetical protein
LVSFVRGGVTLRCSVDLITIDRDSANEEKTTFQLSSWLTLLVAILVDERVCPDVANLEANQDFLPSIDSLFAATYELLSLGAGYLAVDIGILNIVSRAVQRGYGTSEESWSLPDRHLANAVQVAEASGVEVKELGVGLSHDVSPVVAEKNHDPGGK